MASRWCWGLWVAVVVGLFAAPSRLGAEPEESVQVYRKVQSAVVLLQNAEGAGTGVILQADGLILTNAHVISSPMAYSVQVEVPDGNTTKRLTFKKVTVVGFHPRLDLALIRIDPAEHGVALTPAELAKDQAETGQRVYVIGNPAAGGQVLNKSITSGMISAAQREFDGDRYYQLDAAVNPGNSGGPACDKQGRVLGLVTFKMQETEAIAFAIPLHDLDPKSFVPLSQRRSQPEKARELIKLGNELSARAFDLIRQEGRDSRRGRAYSALTAYCYRLAILEDPSNGASYYNVGLSLRAANVPEVAIAYLARSIQMGPWESADAYRELGFALALVKRDAEARVAWHEGLAKFPYTDSLWEDLAIQHRLHEEYAEAAYYATGALLTANQRTRRDTLNSVLRDFRAQLTGEVLAAAERRLERSHLVADMEAKRVAANEARQARKLYVTAEFATLIAKVGGPDLPGVAAKIDPTPLPAPLDFRATAPATSQPALEEGDWILPRPTTQP